MTFAELVSALQARGFDYLDDTVAGRYVNDAIQALDNLELWPYREASATGVAPLGISDLGTVEAVTNESLHVPLEPREYRSLIGEGDLSLVGTPVYWYLACPDGVPTVATFPVGTDTIGVQYWRVTPELSGADEPAAPARFHSVIVDMAVVRAYLDSDNPESASALQSFVDRRVEELRFSALVGQVQAATTMQIRWGSDDA